MTKTYTINQISRLDKENRNLVLLLYKQRLKIGLELGERLKKFRDLKLYKQLDQSVYLNFETYLKDIGISYKSGMESIGIYETYILKAKLKIEDLKDVRQHHLTILKPHFFKKRGGEYELVTSKEALKNALKGVMTLTQEDLKQKMVEEDIGEHKHDWVEIRFKKCRICRVKEF